MTEKRWEICTGSEFEELAGYSRAIVDGDRVLFSGTAGFVPRTGAFPDDPAQQARLALKQIANALNRAGGSMSDNVRVRVYLSDRAHVMPASQVLGDTFSDPRPTSTTIICGFAVPEIQVEIEATALVRNRVTPGQPD